MGSGTIRECAPLIEAYERRCRDVLGPSAAALGVPTVGFWTLDEFKSALIRKMKADGESAASITQFKVVYDELLQDLNRGDASYNTHTLAHIQALSDPHRFLNTITRGRTTTDPTALAAMGRIQRGGRYDADVTYVKRVFSQGSGV